MITPDAVLSTQAEDFATRVDPYRRELLGYAYRMLGSLDDAEDVVQETLLRAWRSYDGFAGRASLRTWLYRIATNACLRAIERVGRRPLPADLAGGGAAAAGRGATGVANDVLWLSPMPDALLVEAPADPAAVVVGRASVRLAFIAALQHLPARQRAALILCDVLAWPAADVARLLDLTTAGVTSALQRARVRLAEVAPTEEAVAEPGGAAERQQVRRYVTAFENADIDALVRLLRRDIVWEMPPNPQWYGGVPAVRDFVASAVLGAAGSWRMLPVRANGQPAFAAYLRDAGGVYRAHGIQVLTIAGDGITRITTFIDAELFARFGLPSQQ